MNPFITPGGNVLFQSLDIDEPMVYAQPSLLSWAQYEEAAIKYRLSLPWDKLEGPLGCQLTEGFLATKPEDTTPWRITCHVLGIISFSIGKPGSNVECCNSLQEAQRRAQLLLEWRAGIIKPAQKII